VIMTAKVRTVMGRRVCATVYDGKGRAHLLSPTAADETVCGRPLVASATPRIGKSCGACAAGAAAANVALRATLTWQ
jgi:hypothetical protein